MRLKKLIKQFDFEERNRRDITLGSDVRLNPSGWLQLEADDDDVFPTTSNLYAKTWVANPDSVKQWIGFEAEVQHSKDFLGDNLTSIFFRLGNGTNEYWWNGGAWEINVVDWNTEAEIATNISTFPATAKKIQVIINLKTSDATVTPLVTVVKILYYSDVEFFEDLVYRSLVPLLRSEIRPIGDYPIVMAAASSTIDLDNDYPLETPYNIVGIDSVFNHTDDASHFTDLYQSYNVGTKVITLSSSVALGKTLWIKFLWEPEVAVTTGQEYSELDKVPALHLTDINLINQQRLSRAADTVADKAAGTAVQIPGPKQADIEIALRAVTASARDQMRIADELKKFFANNLSVISVALDEEYDLWLTSEYDARTTVGQNELHSGILTFRIVKALFFSETEKDVYTVQRFRLTGDMDAVIE